MSRFYSAIILAPLIMSCSVGESEWVAPDLKIVGCEDYQSIILDQGVFYNNVWNKGAAEDFPWSQCLVQNPETKAFGWSWTWPNNSKQIFGYPQVKQGTSPWDPLPVFGDNFPVKLSSLSELRTSHALEISMNGDLNVATSFWLTSSPEIGAKPNKDVIRAEVMVWTYETDGHIKPGGQRIGTISHAGRNWSIWLDEMWGDTSGENSNRWIYICFQADDARLASEFDIVALLNDPHLAHLNLSDAYIADVELGTEIMAGSGVTWVNHFSVSQTLKAG